MKYLFGYLLRVVSAALLGTVVGAICPKQGAGKVVKLACGLLLIVCVVSPLLKLDAEQIAAMIARTELVGEQARAGIEIPTADLAASIISERVRSYVLDKAASLGMQIEAEVSMHTEGAYPYPEAIRITGAANASQRQMLAEYIEKNFAIPADRQVYDS